MLDNYEIRPGKFIGVCVSLDNCRLFIGSIPKDKRKDEIMEEMKKVPGPRRRGRSPNTPTSCQNHQRFHTDRRTGPVVSCC